MTIRPDSRSFMLIAVYAEKVGVTIQCNPNGTVTLPENRELRSYATGVMKVQQSRGSK